MVVLLVHQMRVIAIEFFPFIMQFLEEKRFSTQLECLNFGFNIVCERHRIYKAHRIPINKPTGLSDFLPIRFEKN